MSFKHILPSLKSYGFYQSGYLAAFFNPIWYDFDQPGLVKNNWNVKNYYPDTYNNSEYCLRNQYHLVKLTNAHLLCIKNALIPMREDLSFYFAGHFGVCQSRAWRYTFGEEEIGWHLDKLHNPFLKIMIFRDYVGPDDGPFEMTFNNGVDTHRIMGESQFVILDTGKIRHRAVRPKKGHQRDCIELTLMPYKDSSLPIVSAGYLAGCPIDPTKDWI